MMDNFKKEAYKIRLTPEEKAAMRRQIFGMPSTTSTASPYFFFNMQFMQRAFVPLAVVVVILGGTGTAYAAEGSMPGTPLYAVKINVTEPMRAALAVSAEARAEVHIQLAQRRVEEAEALAAVGALTASTTDELESNFDAHVAEADALALEVGHSDPAAAVEIKARTNSALSVHGAILASLGIGSTGDTKANSARLAARVLARVAVADTAAPASAATRAALKAATTPPEPAAMQVSTFAATAPEPAATAVATATADTHVDSQANTESSHTEEQDKLQSRAEDALKKAREQYKDGKDKFSAETVAALDAQFKTADTLYASGDTTAALMLALKLQTILKAQTKFKGDVIGPLLKLRLDINDR